MAKKKKNESKRKERRPSQQEIADPDTRHSQSQFADFGIGVVVIGLLTAAPFVSEGTAEQFQNWILFFLWLLVLAVVVSRQLLRKDYEIRIGAADCFFYGVCIWICLSGLVCLYTGSGHARSTINSTWQWFGYGVAFFTLRQLGTNAAFRTSAWNALLLLAIGISVSGIYQRYFIYPAVWQSYQELTEEQKKNSMRNGGLSNVEKGSRERVMWENRLHATEPTATFVLTNSLAAYLTPWIIVAVGVALSAFFNRSPTVLSTIAISVLPMSGCLILTKSRTAYLAAAIGLICTILYLFRLRNRPIPWKLIIGMVVVLVVVVAGAFFTGAIDKQVVTEAFKSFSYRLEYWQSSMAVIRDHLFFGVGPGNFQHSYAKYQLVQASETVSDPHNFLMEVGAIAGIPAGLMLLAGIAVWIRGEWKYKSTSSDDRATTNENNDEMTVDKFQATIGLAFGLGLAGFIALLHGSDISLIAIGGLIAVLLALGSISFQSELVNERSATVAILSFGIALLASGGIGFPSVAMTGIFMLAVSPGTAQSFESKKAGQWIYVVLLFASVGAAFLFRATVFDPIRNADQHSQIGQVEAMNGRLDAAIDRLDMAIKADPYDGNFLFFKLQLLYRRFQMNPDQQTIEQMADIAQKSATARPNNSKVTLESGKLFLAILISKAELEENIKRLAAKTVIELFEQATSRRPNDALHASFRALAHEILGDKELAKQWAKKAMDLDALNPHQDKDLRNLPFRLEGYTSERSIEQELEFIRKK